jgi:hypothetical protein
MMRTFFSFFFILFLSVTSIAGGGWLQKRQEAYIKMSQYVLRSDKYFNPEGNIIDVNPGIGYFASSIYAEYGVNDRITAIVYFPFFARSILNNQIKQSGEFVEGDELNTVGDTDITIKFGIIQDKPIVMAARLTLGLPLGEPVGGRTQSLQTGDGEFNQMLSIDVSKSFYPLPLYASTYVGFNNRTNNFSDEIRWGVEAGLTIKNLTLIARINSVHSLFNGNPEDSQNQGIFSNNMEFVSFMPEAIYSIRENFGISAAYGRAFSGRQILANPSYDIGVFAKI